jgi:hypothetical protein
MLATSIARHTGEDGMRRRLVGSVTGLVVTVAAVLVASAGPATAAAPTKLFVNKNSTACSDSGTGTQSQPYCTISAALSAVQAGQTVAILGVYNENVVVGKSGTPGRRSCCRARSPA